MGPAPGQLNLKFVPCGSAGGGGGGRAGRGEGEAPLSRLKIKLPLMPIKFFNVRLTELKIARLLPPPRPPFFFLNIGFPSQFSGAGLQQPLSRRVQVQVEGRKGDCRVYKWIPAQVRRLPRYTSN